MIILRKLFSEIKYNKQPYYSLKERLGRTAQGVAAGAIMGTGTGAITGGIFGGAKVGAIMGGLGGSILGGKSMWDSTSKKEVDRINTFRKNEPNWRISMQKILVFDMKI